MAGVRPLACVLHEGWTPPSSSLTSFCFSPKPGASQTLLGDRGRPPPLCTAPKLRAVFPFNLRPVVLGVAHKACVFLFGLALGSSCLPTPVLPSGWPLFMQAVPGGSAPQLRPHPCWDPGQVTSLFLPWGSRLEGLGAEMMCVRG